jgi:hypothetical protein
MAVMAIAATGWLFRGSARKSVTAPEAVPLTLFGHGRRCLAQGNERDKRIRLS